MKKTRVYIVEDDKIIMMDLHQSLEDQGYEVVGNSESGEDAVPNILRIKPDFILMDINLKGRMDGIEAAAEIGLHQKIPLVFLTGNTEEATLQRAKLTLPYGYIVKPYDPSELRVIIELTLFRVSQENLEADSEINAELELTDDGLERKVEVLSQIELFKNIPRSELINFAQTTSLVSVDAGVFINTEDTEDIPAGFIVLSGRISIMKSTVEGKELIVSSLPIGDIFGLFYLLEGFASCAARAQIDSRILLVPKSSLEILKSRFYQFNNSLLQEISERLLTAYDLASGLAHSQVEDRIVTTILALLPRLGHSMVAGGTSNKKNENSRLFITRKELANLTGTTPETAIRITRNLEKSGYLDLTRPGIINVINKAGLQLLITH